MALRPHPKIHCEMRGHERSVYPEVGKDLVCAEGFANLRREADSSQNLRLLAFLRCHRGHRISRVLHRDWLRGSLLLLLPHVFVLTVIGVVIIYSFGRGIKKQRENWLSYELLVGEDFVIRRMSDLRAIEIRREEVTAIRLNEKGLLIETNSPQRTLQVPSALEEYDEVRARLSEWVEPRELKQRAWRNSPRLLYGIVVVELCLFVVFFLSTRSWLTACSSFPLFLGVIWSSVAVQRNSQLAPKVKRNTWIVLLPLMAIAFRLMEAIRNWR